MKCKICGIKYKKKHPPFKWDLKKFKKLARKVFEDEQEAKSLL